MEHLLNLLLNFCSDIWNSHSSNINFRLYRLFQYNNRWVKDYATALTKKLWGEILFKHQGLQLAGGVTVDGQTLKVEAQEEIERLREELDLLDPGCPILLG
ncbi:hypothetical protein vBKpnAMK6_00422 [Klebsiella phage vB_Kpn_AM_K6]